MNINRLFRRSTHGALWYLALVIAVPVLSLSLLGMLYLWQQNMFLIVLVTWLAITLAGYAIFAWQSAKTHTHTHQDSSKALPDDDEQIDQLPDQLDKRSDWTQKDTLAWQQALSNIDSILDTQPDWESLPEHALTLLSSISAHYNSTAKRSSSANATLRDMEYHFTLPEALLVVSVASDRYRRVVLSHVPFAEKVTVSSLKKLYSRQSDIKTSFTWLNRARRVARLINPVTAAVSELKDQFTDRVFSHLSTSVQKDLKSLLLQEIAQVGIDLYSGKLKSSTAEMEKYLSSAYQEDVYRQAEAIEPIRIVLLGQTSSGKSSMINALAKTLQAEVDTLPTTDKTQTHVIQLPSAAPMHLIDTVGLDGSTDSVKKLAELASEADMIVYLARATQPARGPDQLLYEAMSKAFDARPDRRQPPLLLVMTHVDSLPPRNEWSPPYDLASDNRKSLMINEALQSCITQIGLPTDTSAVPVCLSAERTQYNVDAIAAALMLLQDSAILAQWNRRRVERGEQSISWTDRWKQIKRLGQVVGRATLK